MTLEEQIEAISARVAAQATAPLHEKIAELELFLDETVSQKKACEITGLHESTLRREREREGTLLVVRFGGETGKRPRYTRVSLIAYCKSKNIPITRNSFLSNAA